MGLIIALIPCHRMGDILGQNSFKKFSELAQVSPVFHES